MHARTAPSPQPAFMGQAILCMYLFIVALIPMSPAVGDAQVTTNITSSGLNTQVNQADNSYNITGGTRPGGGPNLFHSFGNFSVGGGDLANFLNNTGLPTSNILGRVTGGNISNIDGTIQTTGFGSANLFLMNPSGIVLGPGASLNVGGSVSFTTAQYLRLFDGTNSANFYANPANDGLANSILTISSSAFEFLSASPAAYGFLTAPDPNATITVQGSALTVPSGQSISLAGGKAVIDGGARLTAPGGNINLANAASPGEFDSTTLGSLPNVNGTSFTRSGSVSLAPGSSIDVHGASTVFIKGGQLVLSVNNATLSTAETPAPPDTIVLSPSSSIFTSTSGTEPGADLHVSVENFRMDGSLIAAVTSGPAQGGALQINTGSLTMENSASIVTFTSSGGGVGGDVVLNVGSASLMGGSSIQSSTQNSTPGAGQGGNVIIQGSPGSELGAANSVSLSGGSHLLSEAFGSSDGGQITLASKSLTMGGADTAIISRTNDVGQGGNIVIGVQHASLSDGATITTLTSSLFPTAATASPIIVRGLQGGTSQADSIFLSGSGSGITSDTTGQGRAGDVVLQAGTITLKDAAVIQAGTPLTPGAGGNVTLIANSIDLSGQSHISSQATQSDAGQVTITANRLILSNASITTQSASEGGGRAGDVVLNVGSTSLSNRATVNSSTSGTGQAGNITMNVSTLELNSGSQVSSASTGTGATVNFDGTTAPPGRAGNITITASGNVISNAGTITTSAEANRGGDISITAHTIQLSNGSLINANSNAPLTVTKLVLDANGQLVEQVVGDGNAGNIVITSASNVIIQNSSVTTEASRASGGQVTITAPNMIQLIDSQISTSVAGGANDSNGGNISIDPDFVILKDSQILAQAFAGSGGAIDITAGLFLAEPSSLVDASSTLGLSGTVQINAAINNLSSVVAHLPESLLAVQTLLRASCAAKLAQGSTSSFVERGRDGIPAGPDGLLASPYLPMTSQHSELRQAKPSTGISGVQLRRLFGKEMPSSVTLFSNNAACSS